MRLLMHFRAVLWVHVLVVRRVVLLLVLGLCLQARDDGSGLVFELLSQWRKSSANTIELTVDLAHQSRALQAHARVVRRIVLDEAQIDFSLPQLEVECALPFINPQGVVVIKRLYRGVIYAALCCIVSYLLAAKSVAATAAKAD